MTSYSRYVHVEDTEVVEVAAQEAVEREYFCRGVRFVPLTSLWSRCGNMAKYYVFVDGADEPRQAVCGFCKNKAKKGKLTVLK